MTRLSHLRSKLFAHKLTSSINDNFEGSDRIDILLTQARLGYETMLSQTNGEYVDHRRSAMKWQITYRQWVIAPAEVVLVLDLNANRQYHWTILTQINHIINHTIISCEQLWLECIILYQHQWALQTYHCESLQQTIHHINLIITAATISNIQILLNEVYHQYYNHHIIILSDRYTRDARNDDWQLQHFIDICQTLWYIRDYPSPIICRVPIPYWLVNLTSDNT